MEGALAFLMLQSPRDFVGTEAHHAAWIAARDVVNGVAAAGKFRDAFVFAAKEAGVLA
ncbi:DUF982 domain-containing protein [Starkeya sp. ORNL1]|nr:DUF982 domain-containing protein [Starkeya sp. ORNL1]